MRKKTSILSGTDLNFFQFVFEGKRNLWLLTIAALVAILQFIIFKWLYPFPDFFSDSFSYIYAASAKLDINIWPIGYSKFLAAFHALTHSDAALIGFQYFFLELSAAYFFFTVIYFYSPGKVIVNILFVFLFANPLFLYLSNYVNSDPLFAALSILWITTLIWIIQRPAFYRIPLQAVLLFFCFTVRNNAYYYPIITIIAFALSYQSVSKKVVGSLAGFLLIIPFIIHSRNEAFKITGHRQFSLFTGWQLANNALYTYGEIQVDSARFSDAGSKELDQISRNFYEHFAKKIQFRDYLGSYVGNYFIRQPESPLKQYQSAHYEITDNHSLVQAWGKSSVVFGEFANQIIKDHPIAYARFFMLSNAKNYFLPPLEKMELYNLGLNNVPMDVQDWFDYKTPDVWCISPKAQGYVLLIFPALFMIVNIFFASGLIWFFAKKKRFKIDNSHRRMLLLISILLVANFGFSVVATINVFRYQFFPLIVCISGMLLLLDWMDKKEIENKFGMNHRNEKRLNLELAKS